MELQAKCYTGVMIESCTDLQQVRNLIIFGDVTCEPITKVVLTISEQYDSTLLDFVADMYTTKHNAIDIYINVRHESVYNALYYELFEHDLLSSLLHITNLDS
jgi:hypothetical protein